MTNGEGVRAGQETAQRAFRESAAMYARLREAAARRRMDPDYCQACGWIGPCITCETDRARWAA